MHNTTMNNIDHSTAPIILKINIPDKGIFEKRFTFNHDDKVWAAKEQVIHEIGKEFKDIQNYGFFVPPYQGKAGKFMDEGRPVSEYSIPGDDQILEFILKRRIYRSISYDENKLTKLHTKTNLKKLMDLVELNNAGQVNQLLEKGLDPNFQDLKSGETPLTTAAVKDNATEVIMFLVNGGAYLDFRNRNGITAVHRAAHVGNGHNIKAFLDLGASPNYRDLKGLTPLYHACLSGKNPNVAELLLGDQSDIGVVDSQGWQEIHQVCRYGHLQHLEQLIFYGADLNAQNGSGNTPLHITALYNQEDCARLLLYRGARRDIVNFANQTAEMVAVVATNVSLSVFIKNYNENDVVPYIDKPTYSTRRRTQSKSRPTANSVFLRGSTDTFIFCSETLSTNSSTSLLSETSEPMSLDLSPREILPQVQSPAEEKSPVRKYKRTRTMSGSGSDSSYVTDSGDETGGSAYTTPIQSPTNDDLQVRWRTYSLSSLNKEERGNVPRVKGVRGAANMKPSGKSNSRKVYVAVKNFTPSQAGELSLMEGDLVEVVTKGEKGYWQGSVSGKTGWFPAECIEELKKRKHKSKNSLHKPPSVASSLNKSNTSLDQTDKPALVAPQPRQVILHQRTGFGFQMKGASAPTVNKLEYQLSEKIPALQYVGSVEPGGVAEERGVRKGDYILEVNGNDVRTASHRHVVSLIRKSGKTLIMKIISVDNGQNHQKETSNTTKTPVALQGTSPPASRPPGSCDKPPMPVVNGTSHGNGVRDHKASKPPPIPSRAPTTSLTRPKTTRLSVEDADVDKSPNIQEDRVITVPRERISPSDSQWQSPLTGHSSLPRRPKSSYGAIIGFTHGPSESTAHKNYRPVESLDNTGFMTLPSKSSRPPNVRQPAAQDDSAVTRRREGSRSKDRPKSWMPKVLPTELPPSAPRSPPKQPSPDALVPHNEETRGDSKKDKKRRFSFKKKKEKDYTAVAAPADGEPLSDDAGVEGDATDENVAENLQIEGEERPNTLPGLNKRLTTFKPVTIPHRQNVENEAVSPELSQALEKRMLRTSSSGSHEGSSTAPPSGYHPPVHSNPPVPNPDVHKLPVNAAAVPVFPVSQLRASAPKSLEQSIKEEMMRRRSNSTSVSGVPAKPRRTFEYKKLDNNNDEGAEPGEQKSDLDSELAKAIARRAAKITSEPAKETPIYENIQNFAKDNPAEPRSSVEEPPVLSIDEKLKKLHLNDEVFLPTKFKPPVKPPPGKGPPEKRPSDKGLKGKVPLVKEPPKEESKVKNRVDIVPSGKPHPVADRPEESTAHGKPPPKTFPKPKKKPSSTASEDTANDVEKTPRPVMTLPLSTEQRMTHIPPPVLSPEMVATQFLDDVIDEEVKRSNWDTASWKDKDLSTPRSSNSPAETGSPAATTPNVTDGAPQEGLSTSSPKKKYVYKITLVTEKAAEGTQSVEEQGSGVTQTRSSESTAKTYVISTDKSERSPPSPPPPPPPPPIEFHDENPVDLSSPVFTPPSSPPPPLVTAIDISPGSTGSDANPVVTSSSSCGTEEESSPGAGAPSPQTEPPPPLVEEQPTPPIGNEPPQSVQEPPPPNVQEAPPPPVEEPPPQHVSEPSTLPVPDSHLSVEEPAPPVQEPPSPPIQEVPPPPPAEEPPPPPMKEPPPPPMTEPPPPPITEPPPPPTEEPPSPPVQELPSPPVQAPPPPPVQEPAPPPVEEQPPPKPMQELPPPPTEPPPPPPTEETPSPPKDSPLLTPEQSPFEKSKTDASSPGEETSPDSFTSPLPPPVITPHTERSLNGAAQTAAVTGAVNASGLKEERMGVPPDHIVVPPPVFADSGDDVRESAQQDETSTPAEMLVSDDIGRSEPVPENAKSVVDGPEKVASVEETSGSVSGPDAAPAPSGDLTEQNVNVVDPSTTNTGQNGELAPQEAVGSDAFSSSLTFRDMSYENWTCVHVCQWLDSIGMAEHQGLFEENDIRGVNLSGLTKEDLKELGVKKLGHRMTMADAVHTLAINHGAATNL